VISAVLGLSCFHSILDCIVFLLDVIFGNVQFTAVIMLDLFETNKLLIILDYLWKSCWLFVCKTMSTGSP
jgi:hypothetical protein